MKFDELTPPRVFTVGNSVRFHMRDCGRVSLDPDEQVTFVTEGCCEYDVARKDWGFYATPSLNGRLPQFGLRAVLIRNIQTGRYFVLLVEQDKEDAFDAYQAQERLEVIAWMDTTERLDAFAAALRDDR